MDGRRMQFHFCCVVLALAVSSSTAMPEHCIIPAVKDGEVGNYLIRRFASNRSRECFYPLLDGDSIDNGDSVILRCEKGYLPAGSPQTSKFRRFKEDEVTCKGGTWSEPLICEAEITCGEPPSIEFGTVTSLFPEDYPLGAIVAYECQPGYVIKGRSTTSKCIMSDDGSKAVWTKAPMSCKEVTCDEPQALNHGFQEFTDGLKVGSLVTYSCEENKILVGSSTSKCLSDGQWTFPPPKCVGIVPCDLPPKVKNAKSSLRGRKHVIGRVATYRCNSGYTRQVSGEFQSVCEFDEQTHRGRWTVPNVVCIPVCKEGCHPEHGYCDEPGQCKCRLGWKSENCDECIPYPGCEHGYCDGIPWQCNCDINWDGLLCDQAVCKEGCHPEHGYCDEPGQCKCRAGWKSGNCDECIPYPGCKHGYCDGIAWQCICDINWAGLFCDQRM